MRKAKGEIKQIYVYVSCVCFQIGDFIDGNLTVNFNKMRDYTNTGIELQWPYLRRAQCPNKTKCIECIPFASLHEDYILDKGDAYVIGVNPIFESSGVSGCGDVFTTNTYQTVEAMRFAISQVKENLNMFENLNIGFIGLSSCNNGAVIQRKIYDLFKNGLLLKDGTRLYVNGKVLGFVGDVGSSISISVAEALTRLQFAQISYASTSPLLSDRDKYPFFLRVVTPDNYQAKAMVTILKNLKATYVQLVYSKGAYGEGGRDKVLEEAKKNDICILEPIGVDDDVVNGVYGKLKIHPEAKLVIVFVRSHVVPKLVEQLQQQMNPGEFEFIGSETWAKNDLILEKDVKQLTQNSITLVLEMYQDSGLKTDILAMDFLPFAQNPWVTLYLQEKRSCYFELGFDKTKPELCDDSNRLSSNPAFSMDGWATPAYIATLSLLYGSYQHFKNTCGSQATALCGQFSTNKTRK